MPGSYSFILPQPLNLTPLAASGNSTALVLNPKSADMMCVWHIKFTLGSLTNCTVTIQILNPDGSTWQSLNGAQYTTGAMTVSTNTAIPVVCSGVKSVRATYTTTGTVTSSQLIIDCTVRTA